MSSPIPPCAPVDNSIRAIAYPLSETFPCEGNNIGAAPVVTPLSGDTEPLLQGHMSTGGQGDSQNARLGHSVQSEGFKFDLRHPPVVALDPCTTVNQLHVFRLCSNPCCLGLHSYFGKDYFSEGA